MLSCQKSLFALPDDEHYLNCAYMSPLSTKVEEAGVRGLARKRVPSRLSAADFFTETDRARALFARLVNAPDPQRIAVIPSASYGLAVVARNLPLSAGQNVVVTHEQFPANIYPWRKRCASTGAELRVVRPPEVAEGRGRLFNERVLEAIDARTAMVALGHVHWTDGTRFDLEAVGARTRDVGAALVVDGTQSVGAMPFDVQRLQPDALVCAAYKWLMGPYSIGFAYYAQRFDDGDPLEETWIGRLGSENFKELVNYQDEYQPGALRYDVGERSNFVLMPMAVAALEQVLEWTPDGIQAYSAALTTDLVARVRALGFGVEGLEGRGAHLFGLRTPPGVDIQSLAATLAARQVHVSLRGSAVRVSPHVYNDARDVEALYDALAAAVQAR
ncbi:MAG: aminotransferase class V-fold PLP-dependent enzyme [Acidobacteriota bacterium]|nr:aminotransferase class V-fold PLP-dependent enzyme [Acidobacteriota bacterium]